MICTFPLVHLFVLTLIFVPVTPEVIVVPYGSSTELAAIVLDTISCNLSTFIQILNGVSLPLLSNTLTNIVLDWSNVTGVPTSFVHVHSFGLDASKPL